MRMLGNAAVGLGFGFVMSRAGFTSWDLVHGMFTFTDPTLLLAFVMSVVLLVGAWIGLDRASKSGRVDRPRKMHPGLLPGGALFGIGWALCGACPTIAFTQLGEGQLAAVYTIIGIFVGNYVYSRVHERFFRWPISNCLDD